MALTTGIFGQTILDQFDGSDSVIDYTNDAITVWLLEDTFSPDYDGASSDLADIVSGSRVTGTGTFSSTLDNKSVDLATANYVTFDADDEVFSTLTTDSPHIQGCVVFDDTLTTPQTDPMICILDFAANFDLTGGNFTVQWGSNGVFRLGLV